MPLEILITMSTTPLSPFPDLAAEICEIIFQFSSESDNPSRWSLSVVSREVQKWTDPILFRHITFQGQDPRMDDPGLELERFDNWVSVLYSNSVTPRFERALSCVRTLYIAYNMGHTKVGWHLIWHVFPKLIAIAADDPWDYVDVDECGEREEHPTLRFAYGAISSLFEIQQDCTILSNITHMELGHWVESSFTNWSIFRNLLCVSVDGSGTNNVVELMPCLPSTVLLVVFILKAEDVDDSPLDADLVEGYVNGKLDPRLLLFWCGLEEPPSTFGPWVLKGSQDFSAMAELREMWGSKESTFWECGLRMIEERGRG
ncbi:hypothetical protein DL96DRAFT_1610051 [Flagelloscypha sp. PMI_526]|nr:hypothetical protein DL96DRAFT_1610051 [Flagelloscypha sp. PMI_526]